jgi:hypothetical protein
MLLRLPRLPTMPLPLLLPAAATAVLAAAGMLAHETADHAAADEQQQQQQRQLQVAGPDSKVDDALRLAETLLFGPQGRPPPQWESVRDTDRLHETFLVQQAADARLPYEGRRWQGRRRGKAGSAAWDRWGEEEEEGEGQREDEWEWNWHRQRRSEHKGKGKGKPKGKGPPSGHSSRSASRSRGDRDSNSDRDCRMQASDRGTDSRRNSRSDSGRESHDWSGRSDHSRMDYLSDGPSESDKSDARQARALHPD